MNKDNIDTSEMTSREIGGNLISKTLIKRGKKMVSRMYPSTDYDDLSAETLTILGK